MNINPFDILKNAQKIQEQMGSLQEKLGGIEAAGSSGGGMVEVTINGKMEMTDIAIRPEMLDPNDVQMLQDLIVAAHANAMEKIREKINEEMGALAGGMELPPGFPGIS